MQGQVPVALHGAACPATGASMGCQHGQAQVKVLAVEVRVTQSREECGKCSPATAPREMQAGPGLPARPGSSAACTAPRATMLARPGQGGRPADEAPRRP